jgi:hypothetical protein
MEKTNLVISDRIKREIKSSQKLEVDNVKYVKYNEVVSIIENQESKYSEENPNSNDEEVFLHVKKGFNPINVGLFAAIPFSLYLLICIFTQSSILNIEMLTGGILRIASGGFALFGIEFLSIFAFYRLFFRLLFFRFMPNISSDNPKFDFLTEYLELEGWKRVLLDFCVLFGFLFLLAGNMYIVSTLPTMGAMKTGL